MTATASLPRARAPRKRKLSGIRQRETREAWIILTPILLYFSIFFLFPVISNFYISFTRWNGISGAPQWIGFKNYLQYLKPPYTLIISNTLLFAVFTLVFQTALAFLIAVLLNQKVKGRGIFRALFYIPTLTSAAITAQVAFAFISPYDGVLNEILKMFGHDIVVWTINANWMRLFIIVYSIWRGVGGPVVLFLAALQGIHREIYEAAMVDGASGKDLLWHITVPLLKPMIIFVLITGMIGSFQIFEAVLLMSKGGPQNKTNVMLLQIYNDAFVNTNMGLASAGSMVMAILLLGFSITNMRIMSRGQVIRD
ncbi:MAG: sugar ABC transporter permease [Anaerolineae bacterium]|nr:sugar ABC transporter permease [Anaerolineae bacterium]